MDNPILHEFLAETGDLLEILFGDLQTLRARHTEGRARRELVGRIFRHVHTIKGSSATVELEAVTELAHEFENLLDNVRLGRTPVDAEVLDAFDAAAAAISQGISAVSRGESPSKDRNVIESLRSAARSPSAAGASTPAAQKSFTLPDDVARSLSKHEAHRLQESLEEGARLFAINVHFDLATFDERFRNLSDALAEDGEIISTLPGIEGALPDKIGFRIIYATKATKKELSARISAFGENSVAELTRGRAVESKGDERTRADDDPLSKSAQPGSIASLSSHVRVELAELDAIISSAHEILKETTDVLALAQSLGDQSSERALIDERAALIRQSFVKFEEELIALRMVPVAQILERAARAGRMAARATGKEVEFETEGGHVRLDKALADGIADPLLHILRNAVDHGIERPAERGRIGKKKHGRVRLEATAAGNRVVVRVSDDGRGIDPLRITRAAVAQGLIEAGRLLTKEQCLRLIFRPGFSTAASVSSVSGRGVGLDVVERAVEQAGGELRVFSEQGAGTTFELVLPTTLALLPSLVVHSAGHRYCIDASHILETGFMAATDVERNLNAGEINWRGARLPLVQMRGLLAQQPFDLKAVETSLPVIIVTRSIRRSEPEENGAGRAAIVVDGVDGQTEALVRGLGRYASRWRGISGATELQDGTLALVLDLPRLLETVR
ncbi:MAG TPA: ATP-binding protein [Pyrinomonadaceae bacterium]